MATAATMSLLVSGVPVRATLQDGPKAIVDEAWQIVNREYVDPTFNRNDWQAVRQSLLSKSYTSNTQAYDALRQALKKLEDPYTRFMDPKQFEALNGQTSGELSGVGIKLELNEKSKVLTVVEPLPNSPAMKAGVQPGDQVLAIDSKSTKGMSVEDASNLIRGEAGKKVVLRLGRGETGAFDQPLVRARIELQTVTSSLRTDGKRPIGYIRLNEFSSHAADQMRQAIQKLQSQKAEALVLDMRGNPGGLLQASIEISRMWLDQGAIVKTVDRKGGSEEITANQTAISKLPLAILVDGNSASSSEILTGALKDNKRATVVGAQTFGKALVQSVHPLSDGSGLAVTIAHYYTPNGTDISHKGIAPDVKIELTDAQRQFLSKNQKLIGTTADPQYARAVEVLETASLAQQQKLPQTSSSPAKLLQLN
jgi:carboxyl-terminal processing protease